jgi:Asp-tRNA(Asn)/Glu-tRNA(Gln) amidotransferase A subunit family amidase
VLTECFPVALSTDLDGSSMISAAHAGIYGFKVTPGRVPLLGLVDPRLEPLNEFSMLTPSVSILYPKVEDCAVISQVLFNNNAADIESAKTPLHWNQ